MGPLRSDPTDYPSTRGCFRGRCDNDYGTQDGLWALAVGERPHLLVSEASAINDDNR